MKRTILSLSIEFMLGRHKSPHLSIPWCVPDSYMGRQVRVRFNDQPPDGLFDYHPWIGPQPWRWFDGLTMAPVYAFESLQF